MMGRRDAAPVLAQVAWKKPPEASLRITLALKSFAGARVGLRFVRSGAFHRLREPELFERASTF